MPCESQAIEQSAWTMVDSASTRKLQNEIQHLLRSEAKKSSAPIAASWQVHIFIGIKITQYKCLQNPEQKLSYTHTNNIPKNKRKKSTDEMGDTQCRTSGIILVPLVHFC